MWVHDEGLDSPPDSSMEHNVKNGEYKYTPNSNESHKYIKK